MPMLDLPFKTWHTKWAHSVSYANRTYMYMYKQWDISTCDARGMALKARHFTLVEFIWYFRNTRKLNIMFTHTTYKSPYQYSSPLCSLDSYSQHKFILCGSRCPCKTCVNLHFIWVFCRPLFTVNFLYVDVIVRRMVDITATLQINLNLNFKLSLQRVLWDGAKGNHPVHKC